jgi:demethoxyubiquinone hydroxylase (CLK1/Coq7/Cat5 family)
MKPLEEKLLTSLSPAEKRVLVSALLTEVQAISIYEAQIFILRNTALSEGRRVTLKTCSDILLEEKLHSDSLFPVLAAHSFRSLLLFGNRISGYTVGAFLSLLPHRLHWRVHVWAEIEAARAYRNAARALEAIPLSTPLTEREGILNFLKMTEIQELKHSETFASLLTR